MGKLVAFVLGLIAGIAGTIFIGGRMGIIDPVRSAEATALANRIEAIPAEAENICTVLATEVLSRDDHTMSWTDGKRYVIGGWIVQSSGTPYFYWTGAGLPADQLCPK
jgi:hypothetical protein